MSRRLFDRARATRQSERRCDADNSLELFAFVTSLAPDARDWMFAAHSQEEARAMWHRALARSRS